MGDTAADFRRRGVEFFYTNGQPGMRCTSAALRDAVQREIARRVLALADWSPGMVTRLGGLPPRAPRYGLCDCCDDAFGPLPATHPTGEFDGPRFGPPRAPHPTGDYRSGWCELCTAAVRRVLRARGTPET